MNILFVSTDYIEPGRGATGLPSYLNRMATALSRANHEVAIIYGAVYNQCRVDEDITIYSVRIPNVNFAGNEDEVARKRCLLTGYVINKKVNWFLQNKEVDIIQYASLNGIGLFYEGNVPATIRLSSYTKFAYSSAYSTLSQKLIDMYSDLEIEAAKHIGHVFGPSESTARAFESDFCSKVSIVESPFCPLKSIDDSVYNDCLNGKKYVLFFGKMYAEKGIVEISEILESFLRSNPSYLFVFVGGDTKIDDKNAYSFIKEKSGQYVDRVVILPELNHAKLFSVIKGAQFVVLPSYMENFSNACLEAMYYNGCVVATRDAGFEQLIDDGITGFLCEKQNGPDLLKTMQKVLSAESKTIDLVRQNARKRISRNAPQTVVDRLIEYYRKVIADWSGIDNFESRKYREEIQKCIDEKSLKNYAIVDADKRYLNSRLLAEWTRALISGRDPIKLFFDNNSFCSVAVYGVMDIGILIIDALEKYGIEVKYTIDKNVTAKYKDYPSYLPSDSLPNVDLVIVTPIIYYMEIKKNLEQSINSRVISVEAIIFPQTK